MEYSQAVSSNHRSIDELSTKFPYIHSIRRTILDVALANYTHLPGFLPVSLSLNREVLFVLFYSADRHPILRKCFLWAFDSKIPYGMDFHVRFHRPLAAVQLYVQWLWLHLAWVVDKLYEVADPMTMVRLVLLSLDSVNVKYF